MTGSTLIEAAVSLVMALAMFELVQALVADLVTPIIAAIVGEFRYGDFINATITFVSVAAAVYFFVITPHQANQRSR